MGLQGNSGYNKVLQQTGNTTTLIKALDVPLTLRDDLPPRAEHLLDLVTSETLRWMALDTPFHLY